MSSDLLKELTDKIRQQIEADLRKKIRDEIVSELAGEMVKGNTVAVSAPVKREKGSSAGLFKVTGKGKQRTAPVYEYLKSINEKMVSVGQIAQATGMKNIEASNALIYLVHKKLAVRVRHGVYMINPVKVKGVVTHIEYNGEEWRKQFPEGSLKRLYPQSLSILKYMASKPWEAINGEALCRKLKITGGSLKTLLQRKLVKRVAHGMYALPDYKSTGKERRISDRADRPVALFYKDSAIQKVWEYIKSHKDQPHNRLSIHLETGMRIDDATQSLTNLYQQCSIMRLRTGWYAFKTTNEKKIQELRVAAAKMASVQPGTIRHSVLEALKTDRKREWTIPELHMVMRANGNGGTSASLKDIEVELKWLSSLGTVVSPTEGTYMARGLFLKPIKH